MFTHEENRQLTCGVKATLWAILKWNHRGFVIRLSTSVSCLLRIRLQNSLKQNDLWCQVINPKSKEKKKDFILMFCCV